MNAETASPHCWSIRPKPLGAPRHMILGTGPEFSRSCARCGLNRWYFFGFRARGIILPCDPRYYDERGAPVEDLQLPPEVQTSYVNAEDKGLRPIGTEIVFPGIPWIFRVVGYFCPEDFGKPPTCERIESIGKIVDGEKRYHDGRVTQIPDWVI